MFVVNNVEYNLQFTVHEILPNSAVALLDAVAKSHAIVISYSSTDVASYMKVISQWVPLLVNKQASTPVIVVIKSFCCKLQVNLKNNTINKARIFK